MAFTGIALTAVELASLPAGCSRPADTKAPTITVFVAASMAEVVGEAAEAFTAETGIRVKVSAAASGVLRQQIEAGATCDVFIAADDVELERLFAAGLALPETRVPLAANELVVMVRRSSVQPAWEGIAHLAASGAGRITIGDPAYVPAGRYAKRALEAAGVWGVLGERLVLADNVRVACQYVRTGQADAGIVYATDVALADDLRIVFTLGTDATGPVVCPAAVCAQGRAPEQARALLAFLAAPEQDEAWTKRGFRRQRSEPRP